VAVTSSSRPRFLLALVLLSGTTVLAASSSLIPLRDRVRAELDPVRDLGRRTTAGVSIGLGRFGGDKALREENARLRRDLDAARASSLRFEDAIRERDELRSLNGYSDLVNIKSVDGRIIDGPISNFDETVEIDRGAKQGVKVGNPVVTGAGLLGIVVGVGPNRARVVPISNASSSVGARLSRSGDLGIARGVATGRALDLDLIDLDTKVATGEVVVTSGTQGSRFPPGLTLGRVAKVRPGTIHQKIAVRPSVDLDRTVYVSVLLWSAP
jgi:rod shape-determining protein MreC